MFKFISLYDYNPIQIRSYLKNNGVKMRKLK